MKSWIIFGALLAALAVLLGAFGARPIEVPASVSSRGLPVSVPRPETSPPVVAPVARASATLSDNEEAVADNV